MTSPLDTPDQPGEESLDALDEDSTEIVEEPDADVEKPAADEPPRRARTPRAAKPDRTRGRTPAAAPAGTPPVETLRYVDDDVSKWWVIAICVAFAAVLLYGIFLGTGGVLTPYHTPSPRPTPAPTASVSAAPSTSAGASSAPSASVSVSAAPSPSPSAASPSPS